jgi:hypothetical protein
MQFQLDIDGGVDQHEVHRRTGNGGLDGVEVQRRDHEAICRNMCRKVVRGGLPSLPGAFVAAVAQHADQHLRGDDNRMSISRREFMRLMGLAGAAGMLPSLGVRPGQAAERSLRGAEVRQRHAAAHHRLPRPAESDLLPRAQRQHRHRPGLRQGAAPGRRDAAQALRHRARRHRGPCLQLSELSGGGGASSAPSAASRT